MAWNLLKKRRENLEKDKAAQEAPEEEPTGGSLREVANKRLERIEQAQRIEDPTISGPFLGGGRKKGTSSGAFPFSLFGGTSGSAAELEEHHRKQAEKYKPGNQTLPSQGTPNLSPKEKEELDTEINMKPRE